MIPTLLLFAASLLGPYLASSSYAVDLNGPVDTREGTWGTAEAFSAPITFHPPVGYRVRVLRLRGDLTAWARILPGEASVPSYGQAGVLVGFQTTAGDGSVKCVPCADNTMVYLQGALNGDAPVRIPFDVKVKEGGLLETDNKLVVKVASWLNTTGKHIHMEPTFTVTYRFEEIR